MKEIMEPENPSVPNFLKEFGSFEEIMDPILARLNLGRNFAESLVRRSVFTELTRNLARMVTRSGTSAAGTGTPTCGNDLDVLVTKDVVPQSAVPGVETEFTYTVTLENTSATDRYICEIEDRLPPEYTYVLGSSGDYPGNIDTFDPDEKWLSIPERWRLEWGDGNSTTTPLVTLTPGETRTQIFRATATVEPGINYYNEIQAGYALTLEPGGGCLDSGTAQGGAAGPSSVATPSLYDIQAVASDGSIKSRIVFYESSGDIEILSWQEY